MKHKIAAVLILTAGITLCVRPAGAANKKQLSVGAHFISAAAIGSSQYKELTDILTSIAAEKGISLVLKQFKSDEEVVAAFLANRVDMAFLWPDGMLPLWDKKSAYSLWATYTVAKKNQRSYCLWQLKNRDTPAPADLANTTLINSDPSLMQYIMLRDYLFSRGIDKPVWKVFKGVVRVPNQNSAFMALSMGKGDFYWESEDWTALLKIINSGMAAKLKHPLCGEPRYSRGGIVINRKNVSKETFATLTGAFKEFAGDKLDAYLKSKPERQSIRQITRLGKIQVTPYEADAYAAEKSLYGKAKNNGWLGEARFFLAQFMKIPVGGSAAIKSDFPYCKSSCGGSKTADKCIVKCMGE